ncbi:MAG: HEAT repeat domain-containing protein [Armatimonadetes bacterium]|nr:HEAT repeat domain-containing protein [Armatimonadota bacterium]
MDKTSAKIEKHCRGLRSKDPRKLDYAANALAEIRVIALPALIEALKDSRSDARRAVAKALVNMGDVVVPALIEALKDTNSDVRRGAAEELGEIGGVHSVSALIEALHDVDWYVRSAAARSLGLIGDVQAVPALIEALKDTSEYVFQSALRALGAVVDASEIPEMALASQTMSPKEKVTALRALSGVRDGVCSPYPIGDIHSYCANLIASQGIALMVRQGAESVIEYLSYLRASAAPENPDTLLRPVYGKQNPTDAEELLRASDTP